jgi:hypothetical protein
LSTVPERDAEIADLERRALEAELDGRKTIADLLARKIEALRSARPAGVVVSILTPVASPRRQR